MKFAVFASVVPAAVLGSPISKVIELISNLEGKIIKEGETSQKIFEKSSELCEDRNRDLVHEITTGKASVEELNAKIAQNEASLSSFTAKVEELVVETARDDADLKAANDVRAREAKDFAAEESELTQTISMLERAVAVLEREMAKGDASFLQGANVKGVAQAFDALVTASMLTQSDAGKLTALIQGSSSDLSEEMNAGAPAAAVYQSQSGGIVQTLQDLKDKAEAQLSEARKTEMTNLHKFQELEQSLKNEIRYAKQDKAKAQNGVSESTKNKAAAEGELSSTQKALDADVKTRSDLHRDCMTKASDFEAEVKSRAEELKALAGAKKAIADSTGNADKIQYSAAQVNFLQMSSSPKYAVVRLVRDLAKKEQSAALTQLASRMSTVVRVGQDPFAKVKGLITDMIEKLESEASADATKKGYCDKELKESTENFDDKTATVNKLTSQIDVASSRSTHLKEQVTDLQNALAKLAKSQAEMGQLRAEENSAFKTNKADLTQGLDGVKLALKILSEYYSKGDSAHNAASGASGGIIGMIEVIESDLTKSLAEIESTEESAASEYEQETKDNAIEKTTKAKDVEYKNAEITSLKKDISETSTDRSSVQEELDAVQDYLSKIKKECTDVAMTYEERKKHHEEEIAGLKEALEVLESETAFVQTSSTHRRQRTHMVLAPTSLRGAIQ